jgi:titin
MTTKTLNNTFYYRVRAIPPAVPGGFTTSAWTTAANPVTVQLPVAITTTALPAGAVNVAYTATASAVNGVAPYTFTAAGLPAGLTMAVNGTISGTPLPVVAPPVTFPVLVTVTDGAAGTASVTLPLVINYTIPVAPTTVTAKVASPNSVILNWVDTSNNETGFTIQRAADAIFTKGLIAFAAAANAVSYTDITVAVNTTYYYRVASTNGLGSSVFASAPLPVTMPKGPLTIATTVLPNAKINAAYTSTVKATGGVAPLAWSATGLPAGLTIAPATGIISGVPLPDALLLPPTVLTATFPVTVTVTDTSIPAVSASMLINLMVNQTKPAVPTGLSVVAASATQVNLAWVDVNNESGYTLERATNNTFKKATAILLPAGTISYSDTTAVTKTTYFYRLMAANAAGKSGFTAAATVTTP